MIISIAFMSGLLIWSFIAFDKIVFLVSDGEQKIILSILSKKIWVFEERFYNINEYVTLVDDYGEFYVVIGDDPHVLLEDGITRTIRNDGWTYKWSVHNLKSRNSIENANFVTTKNFYLGK